MAAIKGLYTRQIANWALSDQMVGDLTVIALRQAIHRCQLRAGPIGLSDKAASTPIMLGDGEKRKCAWRVYPDKRNCHHRVAVSRWDATR
jgi:hypothetical protein